MRYLVISCLFLICFGESTLAQPKVISEPNDLSTPFERDSLSSASYQQAIEFYEVLAKAYPNRCSLLPIGTTDSGKPLHLFLVHDKRSESGDVQTFFINNGIHAGEPCGIDASMMLARDLVAGRMKGLQLNNMQIAIVPVYNIGGALNRGSFSRANQHGPREYGFRGNAKNLDLNRDFMKQDSRNARALCAALHALSPDVFIDTHTTNGADYQYDITVIATQPEKLGPVLGPFMRERFLPALYEGVEASGHPVSPYVYSQGVPQESGIMPFIESPRYSSGFAALAHSLAFITEAHMLKPFAKRVRATEAFLHVALEFWLANAAEIKRARQNNRAALYAQDSVALRWEVDSSRADTLAFRGFKAMRETSKVTGMERLRYERDSPVTIKTVYHAYAKPALCVSKPKGYYVPFAYADLVLGEKSLFYQPVVEVLEADTTIEGQAYYIDDFKTSGRPYEGHYLHHDVKVRKESVAIKARKGDLLIWLNEDNLRHRTASLEPQAPDSYFAWGFFDSWLQQKEHFSNYVFEDTAEKMLATDAALKAEFEEKRAKDSAFRQNPDAQLNWLYERSAHFEKPGRYPVVRIEKEG